MNLIYRTKRIYILFLSLLLAAIFSISISQANAAENQIVITSDDFSVEESASRAVFAGNVIITQPDLKVWSDKLIVYYGDDGPSDIKSLEFIGKVKIVQPEQTAFADRGVYDPKVEILKLFGNVKVLNDSGTITGAELIVDIKNGTSRFPASKDGKRVTAIFSTQ